MLRRLLALSAALALFTTMTATAVARPAPAVTGMVIVPSTATMDATWDTLVSTLDANPNIKVIKTIDHAAGAASVGLDLLPTREVFFGNPALGSPLMVANQTAGIDLPQKIAVWEDATGAVFVGFNSTTYLEVRHELGDVATLPTIAGALAAITEVASGQVVKDRVRGVSAYATDNRLVTVESDADVGTTYDRLIAAIDAAPPSVFFELGHSANAATVGIDLPDTRLIVFGSPVLGTPLIAEAQSMAIDLPLKFLVYDDDGVTKIAYNDIHAVARRHGIRGQDALLDGIAGALAGLSGAGAGG